MPSQTSSNHYAPGVKAEVSKPSPTLSTQSAGQGPSIFASATSGATPVSSQLSGSSQNQVSSPAGLSSTALVQFAPSNSAEFAPVTASSLSGTPTQSGVQYPGTSGGNIVMATGFNEAYKKLDETSQCNPNDSNQASVCISGELASCQSDGTYVLKSCPNGQSCYALPKASGQAGVDVACAFPGDAADQLSENANASNNGASISKATSSAQSATTHISTSAQAVTKLPQTEGVQMPVQKLSSSSATATSSPPLSASIASTAAELKAPQSSAESGEAQVQTPTSSQDQVKTPSTAATIQPSTASQLASSQPTVQTLQSFPSAEATQHSQPTASVTPSSTPNPAQANSPEATATHSSASIATASIATAAPDADSGPLFTLPTTTQKDAGNQEQSKATNPPAQETSKVASSPSVLAQEQPPQSTETSVVPAPHVAQAAPQASQPAKAAAANPPKSNGGDSGIVIVPEGGSSAASNPGTNEKVAVQKAQQSGTPIIITVTVTTTAYEQTPTA